jgi:RNA polymerase sigma-70 factor, ECF subfamily
LALILRTISESGEPIRAVCATVLGMATAVVSDVDLVAAMSQRDEGALRLLYERHAGWISSRLRRRCVDRDVVVDVLQDTFVAAWESAGRFRGDGEVAAWLWGIAIHRLISHLRTRSARAPRLGPALLPHDGADESAEEQVLLAIEYSDIGSALARISPELQVVLQATVLDGLTTREAAHLLGIPQGTVKTRLARARIRMREELT